MKRRKKLTPRRSKKMFTRTAKRVHRKNGMGRPMRGGIRL
jgi:hypothetical protein